MLLLLCLLLGSPQSSNAQPYLSDPKPITPANHRVVKETAQFTTDAWVCQIRPVRGEALLALLRQRNVSDEVLNHPPIRKFLGRLVTFEIAFQNKGENPITFNPDQVHLVGSGTVQGRLLWRFDLIPAGDDGDPRIESLAKIFDPSSFSVPPGRVVSHLLAFRAIGDRLPKRVTLELAHVYTGDEDLKISCRYNVRYRKQ